MQKAAEHKGEFLKSCNYNFSAVNQGLCKLAGVLIDWFNHSLCVLNLIDGVLELFIQNPAVCDNDDAVEYLFIRVCMKARKPV